MVHAHSFARLEKDEKEDSLLLLLGFMLVGSWIGRGFWWWLRIGLRRQSQPMMSCLKIFHRCSYIGMILGAFIGIIRFFMVFYFSLYIS